MRTKRRMPAPALAAGALILAMPATALAVGETSRAGAQTPSSTDPSLHVDPIRGHVAYGRRLMVRGTVPASDAGERVALEFQAAGRTTWRTLSTTRVGRHGGFTLEAAMRRSGLLRVAGQAPSTANVAAVSGAGAAGGSGSFGASAPARVRVGASFRIGVPQRAAVAGRPVTVRGRLLPGTGGRVVRLITRSGRRWHTLAWARTGAHGGFSLHVRVPAGQTEWLRVTFAGDRANARTSAGAGNVTGLMYRVASWYDDGGQTACGFHATYGVANKTLPCGTKVTIAYAGRSVVATVDDRGPFVPGRDYDLNQNVAAVLGMHGVATVLASR
jgi:rare lipoprotein A